MSVRIEFGRCYDGAGLPMVELKLEIHSSSIETLSKLYRNFIETLSKRLDLVEIRMEILSSSDYRQRFFFWINRFCCRRSKN